MFIFVAACGLNRTDLAHDRLIGQLLHVISSDLWENHGKLAIKLDKPRGKLQEQITHWLKTHLENGDNISNLTSEDYLQVLNEQHTATLSP
ncbi:hypothetical protein ACSLVK_16860 [Photorhabdus tasmaniensis]|uniref:hypothetical protein n=1 Tax=Photorhabdus tasmaniensis TaxID=1004159 RepID=UPI0040416EB3